jgi:hypothetical protein
MESKISKITTIWLDKLQNNERLTISDLYPFSKINLKKRRNKKKFDKHYIRYVKKEIYQAYWGCLFAHPLVSSFKFPELRECNNIEPINDSPNVELVYLDYKYENK